jgi:hypothetical protein
MASIISAGTTSGTALNMAGDTSGVLQLATNGSTTAITIDTSQNVGIGTASPTGNLDIASSSNVNVYIRQTTGVCNTRIKSDSTNAAIGTSTDHQFSLLQNNTEAVTIDTSKNLKFNSGYGSVATAYGCRAWVNFNGTGTVAIRSSGNVTSITDNGTGAYTINFTNNMPDANYSAVLTCNQSASGSGTGVIARMIDTATTSALPIQTVNLSATAYDQAFICCAVFR